MNPKYEEQLEAGLRRELQALGELEAPSEIARRVMRVVEQRAVAPWYRRAWQTWPLALRVVSFCGLLAAFSFLCFGSWRLIQSAVLTPATREISAWFSLAEALWSTVNALATALALAFRNLDPAVFLGGVGLLLICYAVCVGLGTVYVRLAFARR